MNKLSPKGYPWIFLMGIFGLLLPFQNCAPAQLCDSGSSSSSAANTSECITQNGSNTEGSGSAKNNGSNSGNSGGRIGGGSVIVGGGTGGGSGSGSTTGGGGNGSVVVIGGGGGGGSGSGGGVGGGGPINRQLRFLSQPTADRTLVGQTLNIRVSVTGGKIPYSYKWHKDNKLIEGQQMGIDIYSVFDTGYSANGVYSVVVTDADGESIRSTNLRVTLQDRALGCRAGKYFTFASSQIDIDGRNITGDYLDSPAGKFLLHESFDQVGAYIAVATGYRTTNVPRALQYDEVATISSCHTAIPRIHTPTRNPSNSGQYDGDGYTYTGQITFKCRNDKLLFISNTCSWKAPVSNPDNGGNDR